MQRLILTTTTLMMAACSGNADVGFDRRSDSVGKAPAGESLPSTDQVTDDNPDQVTDDNPDEVTIDGCPLPLPPGFEYPGDCESPTHAALAAVCTPEGRAVLCTPGTDDNLGGVIIDGCPAPLPPGTGYPVDCDAPEFVGLASTCTQEGRAVLCTAGADDNVGESTDDNPAGVTIDGCPLPLPPGVDYPVDCDAPEFVGLASTCTPEGRAVLCAQ